MQVKECLAGWGQTDLAPEAAEVTRQVTQNAQVTLRGEADASVKKEQKEIYAPTEEGLLLYMEKVKSEMRNADAEREAMNEELKVLKIAQNIMRGMQVPSKDESFLMSKNYKLYMAAKNVGLMRQTGEKAKSVFDGEDTQAKRAPSETGGQSGSVACADYLPGAGEAAVSAESADFNSRFSVSKPKVKKTKKRFFYNFKDISAKILSARTSGSARRVLSTARQKTALLRKKMKSKEYDERAVELAIIHAEAMERVAKKKMRHLQEEEAARRGGPCAGDIDREQLEEQMRQDEQMRMEMQTQETAPDSYALTGQPEEEFSTEDRSVEELMADSLQAQSQMLDLTDVMDEFIEEFSELMMDSVEEISSLEELADELTGESAVPDMDPEDLKALKLKHRTKEQKEIAEADSRYLKALFQKLQREQQAVSSNAAKAVAAMAANSGGGIVSLTGSAVKGATGGVSVRSASAPAAQSAPAESAMAVAAAADAPSSDMGVSVSAAVSAVTTGACIDVSV